MFDSICELKQKFKFCFHNAKNAHLDNLSMCLPIYRRNKGICNFSSYILLKSFELLKTTAMCEEGYSSCLMCESQKYLFLGNQLAHKIFEACFRTDIVI